MKKQFYLENLYCELELKNKRKPLFVSFHGLFGSIKDINIIRIKNALVKHKYNVLSFDYSGHGRSKGHIDKVTISKILQNKNLIMNYSISLSNKIYLVGYSFGAYPVLLEASKNKNILGIILFSPVLDILPLIFSKKTSEGLSKFTKEHKKRSLVSKLRFFFDAVRYNLYRESRKIVCPVFLVQSLDDKVVPHKQAIKLKKSLKVKKKFLFFKGENHRFSSTDTVDKKVIPKLIEWIKTDVS
ncbi:alpha/beta fold hydrolase [Candidatus Woesearchaeota archaeon]|nr:alpha/beta fold hydrolase [Candidatus Woesearchaeota archaeon]